METKTIEEIVRQRLIFQEQTSQHNHLGRVDGHDGVWVAVIGPFLSPQPGVAEEDRNVVVGIEHQHGDVGTTLVGAEVVVGARVRTARVRAPVSGDHPEGELRFPFPVELAADEDRSVGRIKDYRIFIRHSVVQQVSDLYDDKSVIANS